MLCINIQRYTIMAKRQFNDSYLIYGFTFVERRDELLPQRDVCHKTLSNAPMKPS